LVELKEAMTANPTLADVQARRAAINEERQQIAQRERMLAAEENELAIAARVLERMASATPTPAIAPEQKAAAVEHDTDTQVDGWQKFKKAQGISGTEPLEHLLTILLTAVRDPWQSSNELQIYVGHLKGKPVPMSSISPTLSIMKNKGIVIRDGLKVALAARVPEFSESKPELSLSG
jgi:hypothetical protein